MEKDLQDCVNMTMNTGEEFCASEDSSIMYCDPCKFDNVETEAYGYCHDCNEYLCQNCLQSHRKFRAFRDHNILSGASIPRSKAKNEQILAFKLCGEHRMYEVQFYCCDHKSVFCSLCKAVKHNTCECKRIQAMCMGYDQANLTQAVHDIEDIKKDFEKLKTSEIERIDCILGMRQRYKAELKATRKEMDNFFNELENEIEYAEMQQESPVEDLRENITMYTDAVNHIASLNEHINHSLKSRDSAAIFAAEVRLKKLYGEYLIVKETINFKDKKKISKQTYQRIKKVQKLCGDVYKQMYPKVTNASNNGKLARHPNEKHNSSSIATAEGESEIYLSKSKNRHHVCELATATDTLVLVPSMPLTSKRKSYCEAVTETNPITTSTTRSFVNLRVKQRFLCSIKAVDGPPICNITGSVFMPDRSLILLDHRNSSIILLDRYFEPIDTLPLESRPWDLAVVRANKVIVTLPGEKKLQYVMIDSGKLCEMDSVKLKRIAWGIGVYKRNLITVFEENPGSAVIELRNETGEILRQTDFCLEGETILKIAGKESLASFYITVDQTNGDIYISYGPKQGILCFTFEGQFLHKFGRDEYIMPSKIILDENGNGIMCDGNANKLLLINAEQETINDYWWESDISFRWVKHSRTPQTISVRWEDLTMIVGHEDSNRIQVIKCTK